MLLCRQEFIVKARLKGPSANADGFIILYSLHCAISVYFIMRWGGGGEEKKKHNRSPLKARVSYWSNL